MSKTLRFGIEPARANSLTNRIARYVAPRRSSLHFDAVRAADDYARQVAWEVSPGQRRYPIATRVPVLKD